jgi:hypothetical protein
MSDWAFDKQALDRYLTKSDEDDDDMTYSQIARSLNWHKHRGKNDWKYTGENFTATGMNNLLTEWEACIIAKYYRDNPEPDEERSYYDY